MSVHFAVISQRSTSQSWDKKVKSTVKWLNQWAALYDDLTSRRTQAVERHAEVSLMITNNVIGRVPCMICIELKIV